MAEREARLLVALTQSIQQRGAARRIVRPAADPARHRAPHHHVRAIAQDGEDRASRGSAGRGRSPGRCNRHPPRSPGCARLPPRRSRTGTNSRRMVRRAPQGRSRAPSPASSPPSRRRSAPGFREVHAHVARGPPAQTGACRGGPNGRSYSPDPSAQHIWSRYAHRARDSATYSRDQLVVLARYRGDDGPPELPRRGSGVRSGLARERQLERPPPFSASTVARRAYSS